MKKASVFLLSLLLWTQVANGAVLGGILIKMSHSQRQSRNVFGATVKLIMGITSVVEGGVLGLVGLVIQSRAVGLSGLVLSAREHPLMTEMDQKLPFLSPREKEHFVEILMEKISRGQFRGLSENAGVHWIAVSLSQFQVKEVLELENHSAREILETTEYFD